MTQEQLNHLMLLHVHKERTDKIDLKSVVNQFNGKSEHRSSISAKYQLLLPSQTDNLFPIGT